MSHHADQNTRPDAATAGIEALSAGLSALAGRKDTAAPKSENPGDDATVKAFAKLASFAAVK